jgi:hypothetical protein
MTRTSFSLLLVLPFILASCASAPPVDWDRPFQPLTTTPVFLHDLTIANPPYPLPHYPNYLDEPTRFVFRPRRVVNLPPDTTAEESLAPEANDLPYLQNGILYVDPNAIRTLP